MLRAMHVPQRMLRTIHVANSSGHVTLCWTEEDDAKVAAAIDEKIAAGWTFFIARVVDGEELEVRMKTAADLKGGRSVIIDDSTFERLFKDGSLRVVPRQAGETLVTTFDPPVTETATETATEETPSPDAGSPTKVAKKSAKTSTRAKSGAEVVEAGAAVAVRPFHGG